MIRSAALSSLIAFCSVGLMSLWGCAGGGATKAELGSNRVSPGAQTNAGTTGVERRQQRSDLFLFGTVAYDSVTMPLSSPDGRHIATQTGLLIDPMQRKGLWSQSVPVGTRIELYDLVAPEADSADSNAQPAARLNTVIGEGLLLGRSAGPEGFIVEAPQENGARWIGLASWETGEVEWLVTGPDVNAHAALGPGGRLAWCRRAPHEDNFELVVRVDGNEWSFRDEDLCWLMPTWSATGEGLFAFRAHKDGLIQAWYMSGKTEQEMLRARRPVGLTKAGTIEMAADLVRAQPAITGVAAPREPILVFQNPEVDGLAVWRPFRPGALAYSEIELGSTAAAIHESGLVLFAGKDGTEFKMLDGGNTTTRLSRQVALPHVTSNDRWPFLLFTPNAQNMNELHVTGVNPMKRPGN